MRVIGVLDLRGGHAVRARGGDRARYAPVARAAGAPLDPPGDAAGLARVYRERLGVRELYAADLDAILDRRPQAAVVRAVASAGLPLWLDAGVADAAGAREAVACGASRVIVGLETLPSFDALGAVCAAVGGGRVALSVDLRGGELLRAPGARLPAADAPALAAHAAALGVGSVIVLDLARVGMGAGLDLALLARVREAAPAVTLLAGGGVRDAADLRRLAAAGCDGALVASALLDGRIGADEVRDVAGEQ